MLDLTNEIIVCCFRTYIPEEDILKNRFIVYLLEKYVQYSSALDASDIH